MGCDAEELLPSWTEQPEPPNAPIIAFIYRERERPHSCCESMPSGTHKYRFADPNFPRLDRKLLMTACPCHTLGLAVSCGSDHEAPRSSRHRDDHHEDSYRFSVVTLCGCVVSRSRLNSRFSSLEGVDCQRDRPRLSPSIAAALYSLATTSMKPTCIKTRTSFVLKMWEEKDETK